MTDERLESTSSLFLPLLSEYRPPSWQPSADTYYKANRGWLIKLELAGVRSTDLTIRVQGSQLIVQGCRYDGYLTEDYLQQTLEILYSRFERIINLPNLSPNHQVETSFQNGMLLIYIQETKS